MAFTELQAARVKKLASAYIEKRRPRPEIRDQVDLGFEIDINDQSLEIFSIRPMWRNPDEIIHSPLVKTKYLKSRDVWKIYWMRADMKWHKYQPDPEAESLEDVLEIVERDEMSCFWG